MKYKKYIQNQLKKAVGKKYTSIYRHKGQTVYAAIVKKVEEDFVIIKVDRGFFFRTSYVEEVIPFDDIRAITVGD